MYVRSSSCWSSISISLVLDCLYKVQRRSPEKCTLDSSPFGGNQPVALPLNYWWLASVPPSSNPVLTSLSLFTVCTGQFYYACCLPIWPRHVIHVSFHFFFPYSKLKSIFFVKVCVTYSRFLMVLFQFIGWYLSPST